MLALVFSLLLFIRLLWQ